MTKKIKRITAITKYFNDGVGCEKKSAKEFMNEIRPLSSEERKELAELAIQELDGYELSE